MPPCIPPSTGMSVESAGVSVEATGMSVEATGMPVGSDRVLGLARVWAGYDVSPPPVC